MLKIWKDLSLSFYKAPQGFPLKDKKNNKRLKQTVQLNLPFNHILVCHHFVTGYMSIANNLFKRKKSICVICD